MEVKEGVIMQHTLKVGYKKYEALFTTQVTFSCRIKSTIYKC